MFPNTPPSSPAPPNGGGWQNPFASNASAPPKKPGETKNEPPEPTISQMVVDPVELRKNWDYKTATNGMFGEPLPDGAESWTPYGTPYFGKGVSGKLKEYWWTLTKSVDAPTEQAWEQLGEKWKELSKGTTPTVGADASVGEKFKATAEANLQGLGVAAESVKTAWQAGTADGSVVSPVLRLLGVGLKGIGDIFGLPAVAVEKVQGAVAGVTQTAKDLGVELPEFSPDDNWFTRYVKEQSSIVVGYAAIKIALSPSKDKWDVLNTNVKEGWDAGRIYYSGVYDQTIKEEFLRRYRAGENPDMLAMELENPVAEMAGQLVLDPLNVLGAISHAKTVDRVLDASETAVKASGTLANERALELVDEFGKLDKADDVKAAALFDEFSQVHAASVKTVQETKLVQEYKFSSLSANSNRNVAVREAQNFIGIVNSAARGAGRSAEEMAEFIRAGVMSVSKNVDEVRAGVQGLMHFDAPKLMFSESGIKTFTLIRRMMETEDGVIDASKLLKLAKLEDPAEFMKAAVPLLEAGAKTSFPTVDEMAEAFHAVEKATAEGAGYSQQSGKLAEQFKRLPKTVLAANYLDGKGKKVYGPLNRVLGTFYFSLQGGVAVKNILANTVQILIDQGPKAFIRTMDFERTLADGTTEIVRRPAFWSTKKVAQDLEKMLGFKTPLGAGFETQAESAKAVKSVFANLMSWGETEAANRVVWSSMKDSMGKLMTERYLGSVQPLLDAGASQQQANHLLRLLRDNAGDVERTLEEFRNLHGKGTAESWRLLDYLPQHYEEGFRELDLYDEIADFAKTRGKSQEEVTQFFDDLIKQVVDRGSAAAQDGARITKETPGFESFMKLEEAIHDGSLPAEGANEVLRTWLVASNEAKHQYMESLQSAIDWANRNLPQSQGIQFSERMKTLRNGEFAGRSKAETDAMEIIDNARKWSQDVRNMRNPTSEQLGDIWRAIGINGKPNADITKEGLQMVLWKYFRDQKAAVWEKYYGTVFQESRSIVEDLGKVTDIGELRAQLTQAEMAVERANQLRSSIYRKGTFYVAPGKRDIFGLAKVYDIPGAVGDKADEKRILDIINKYNGDPNFKQVKVGDVLGEASIQSDLPSQSPLALIREHGGLNAAEFSDVAGGKRGIDKAGVMPGLFKEKGAKGIDEVGTLLYEYGFMTREEASDTNKVREFVRSWMDKKVETSKTYIKYASEEDVAASKAANTFDPYYDEAGNLVVPRKENQQFTKLKEVPPEVALEAFERFNSARGAPQVDRKLLQESLIPAYPSGSLPSVARAWNENAKPAAYALQKTKEMILERWGQTVKGGFDPNIEKAIVSYAKGAAPKIAEGKAIALKAAEHWRDFILHNYGAKTYGDLTWAYAMPYRMWYSRTYKNWMKRLVSDPHIVAGYVKYKAALAKLNADKPEFYRGQMEIKGAFGIEFDHPLIFNLEAAINPLNGITGADFNDSDRRVNWWASSLDDMNKFGPSLFAPLQWGIATALSMQGQDDAAQAWAGRAVPETGVYKSLANYVASGNWTEKLGLGARAPVELPGSSVIPGLKYGELDPIVNMFSGGLDKYERGRVGNALAQMVANKQITEEQAIDASESQKGDIWDNAVAMASGGRFGTNVVSWLAGVGFKPRTEADQQIESMFGELNVLRALNKDNRLTPEQYRASLDAMREKYKFMDAVVLSRRGGELRDSMFAYNVLGRLPPGVSRDVLMSVGLDDETINKFYQSKGFTDTSKTTFSESEKTKFMSAVADLSAILELPDYATRVEWNETKSTYKELTDSIAGVLGDDIWDKVSAYYDMRDSDPDKASQFKDAHPEIVQALQMKQEGIVNDPLLFEYYSSIDKLESYFDGKQRQILFNKYGDITKIQSEYFDLKLYNPGAAKALLRQHPELIAYWKEKKQMSEETNRAFVAFASKLPEKEPLEYRSDFNPETATGQQKQLFGALQPENVPTWQDVKAVVGKDMSPAMETLITAYWQNQTPLSTAAEKQLDYLTSRYGSNFGVEPTNTTSFLRMLGIALQKQQAQPGSLSSNAGGWSNPFAGQP